MLTVINFELLGALFDHTMSDINSDYESTLGGTCGQRSDNEDESGDTDAARDTVDALATCTL